MRACCKGAIADTVSTFHVLLKIKKGDLGLITRVSTMFPQELHLTEVRTRSEDSRLPAAFWRALAALTGLTKLVFVFQSHKKQRMYFQELSLLKNLRRALYNHAST